MSYAIDPESYEELPEEYYDVEDPINPEASKKKSKEVFFKYAGKIITDIFADESTITELDNNIYLVSIKSIGLDFKTGAIELETFKALINFIKDAYNAKTKNEISPYLNSFCRDSESILSVDVVKHSTSECISIILIFKEPLVSGGSRRCRKYIETINNFEDVSYDYAVKNDIIHITPEELLIKHKNLFGNIYLEKIKHYALAYAMITESIEKYYEETEVQIDFSFIVPPYTPRDRQYNEISELFSYVGFYHATFNTDLESYEQTKSLDTEEDEEDVLKGEQVDFSGIYGLDTIKSELNVLGECLKYKYLHKDSTLEVPKGVLLVGAPGTGKTFITKAFSKEYGIQLVYLSEYVNNTVDSSSIRRCFKSSADISKYTPVVIFIDEIDKIITKNNDQVMATLLEYLSLDGNFLVVAACNSDDGLPAPLTRPGRFDKKMYFGDLSSDAKINIFKKVLDKKQVDYTNADITSVIDYLPSDITVATLNSIAIQAKVISTILKENIDTIKLINIAENLIDGVSELVKPNKESLDRTAWHEAGHAVVTLLNGKKITLATIKPSYKNLGCVMLKSKEDEVMTHEDYIKMINISLGGWASEKLVFKQLSVGAAADFTNMQGIINFLTTYTGDAGVHLISTDPMLNINYSPDERNATFKVKKSKTKKYTKSSLRLLKKHRVLLTRIHDVLLAKEKVSGEELENIYKDYLSSKNKKKKNK